jgi:uncharacterized heparinase superfamily protein
LWRSWRASTVFARSDVWAPYVVSLRAWALCGLYQPLVAGTTEEDDYLSDLALHARYLRAHVEFDVGGNHLVKNLKALAGLAVFLGDEPLLAFAVRHLYQQVQVQVLADGGHFERSPSYHCQVLGDLMDADALLDAVGRPAAAWLRGAIESMRGWLGAMLMPDGGVPLLNDCVPVPAERLALLKPADAPPGRLTVLQPSGYVVCRPDDRLHLLADVGPPCPPELPAHAHADCLSFELAVDGRRIITDTGTSTYEAGPERIYERSTAAHSTVVVNGEDQTEVWDRFRAARRARSTLHEAAEEADSVRLTASHDGYQRLPGKARHTRSWYCAPGQITVRDEVAANMPVDVCARFHLASDINAAYGQGGVQAGPLLVSSEAGDVQVVEADSEWMAAGFGRRLPKRVLQVRGRGLHALVTTHLTAQNQRAAAAAAKEG